MRLRRRLSRGQVAIWLMVLVAALPGPLGTASAYTIGNPPAQTGYAVGVGLEGQVSWQGLTGLNYALSGSQVFASTLTVQVTSYEPVNTTVNVTAHEFQVEYVQAHVPGPNRTIVNITKAIEVDNWWSSQLLPIVAWNETTYQLALPDDASYTPLNLTINGVLWSLSHRTPATDLPDGLTATQGGILTLGAVMVGIAVAVIVAALLVAKRSQLRNANFCPPFPILRFTFLFIVVVVVVVLIWWEPLDEDLGGLTFLVLPFIPGGPFYLWGASLWPSGDPVLFVRMRIRDNGQPLGVECYTRILTRDARKQEYLHYGTWRDWWYFALGHPRRCIVRPPGMEKEGKPVLLDASVNPDVRERYRLAEQLRALLEQPGVQASVVRDAMNQLASRISEVGFDNPVRAGHGDWKYVAIIDSDRDLVESDPHWSIHREVPKMISRSYEEDGVRRETNEVVMVRRLAWPYIVDGSAVVPIGGLHVVWAGLGNASVERSERMGRSLEVAQRAFVELWKTIPREVERIVGNMTAAERGLTLRHLDAVTLEQARAKVAAFEPAAITRTLMNGGELRDPTPTVKPARPEERAGWKKET